MVVGRLASAPWHCNRQKAEACRPSVTLSNLKHHVVRCVVTVPCLQVFLGLVARLEKGKHDMSFGATALDLANRIVFLSVGKRCCFERACCASCCGAPGQADQCTCCPARWCTDWLCLWSCHALAAEVAAKPRCQATSGAQGWYTLARVA